MCEELRFPPSRIDGKRAHNLFEAGEARIQGIKTPAAGKFELEAWRRWPLDNQGQVEGNADVLTVPGGTRDLSHELQPVGELLRKQHAIREQDRSQGRSIPNLPGLRALDVKQQTPYRFRGKVARLGRLLLRGLRKLLGQSADEVLGVEVVRIYPQAIGDTDWARDREVKYAGRLDPMERRRRPDVC